jgi:tetratricopeptide (TPR) repeat protein
MTERSFFLAALEIDDLAQRQAYLDRACADNPALRAQVEQLLKAHLDTSPFMEQPAPVVLAELEPAVLDGPGSLIGRYRLIEPLGEGGMGQVFIAEQQQPVRRQVALKLIRPGMDSAQVIARFEAERQALALMDHSNIARVLDAGATESGRPYFVMELVKGVPITRYCDEQHLTTRQRLELFVSVCQAVQHAHHKGIIHRDLKPSNVLVTLQDGVPVPKVIDFGIAKATGQQLSDKALTTGVVQLVGTPLYMSPEQAGLSSADVDTRSDIYSLGVLLYELLTGTTPFTREQLEQANYDEFRRVIREEEPPRPSTRPRKDESGRMKDEAQATKPRGWNRLWHFSSFILHPSSFEELDWIVMKCLEKDRNRRYGTATELALDLQRYLADEPVQARPPSRAYRLRKFVRRHKTVLATATVLGGMLLLVAGTLGWWARDRAELRHTMAGKHGQALQEAEMFLGQRRWPQARAALTQAQALQASGVVPDDQLRRANELFADLDMGPIIEQIDLPVYGIVETPRNRPAGGTTVETLGMVRLDADIRAADQQKDHQYAAAFRRYGIDFEVLSPQEAGERLRDRAITVHLAAALDKWALARKQAGKDGEPSWQVLLDISQVVDPDPQRGQLRTALKRKDRQALEQLASVVSPLWPASTLELLGNILLALHVNARALEVFRKAQEQYPDDFTVNLSLAHCLIQSGPANLEEALHYCTAAIALRPEDPAGHFLRATTLLKKGSREQALLSSKEAVRCQPDLAVAHAMLGRVLLELGKAEQAVDALRAAVGYKPDLVPAFDELGRALEVLKLYDQAIAAYQEAIRLRPNYAMAHTDLAIVYGKKGMLDEALRSHLEALRCEPESAQGYQNLATTYQARKDWPRAIAAYRTALEKRPDFLDAQNDLGVTLRAQGDVAGAVAQFKEVIRSNPDNPMGYHNLVMTLAGSDNETSLWACRELIRLKPEEARWHHDLGFFLAKKGNYRASLDALNQAIHLKENYASAHRNKSIALWYLKDFAGAALAARVALKIEPGNADAHCCLGNALAEQPGKLDEALSALLEGIHLKDRRVAVLSLAVGALVSVLEPVSRIEQYAEAYSLLGTVYSDKNMPEQAIAAYRKAIEHDKTYAPAHYNLGNALWDNKGLLNEAIAEYREAILCKPDFAKAYSRLGGALAKQGQDDQALDAFRQACRWGKDVPLNHKNLAKALEKKGLLEEALVSAREVTRLLPNDATAHYYLGTLCLNSRLLDQAIPAFQEALRLQPRYAEAHCNLGHALQRQGRFTEALPAFQRGHMLGSPWRYPSAQWVAQCERLIALDRRFLQVLFGGARPEHAREQVELAGFCLAHKLLYGVAARWYEEAFAAQADLAESLQPSYRFQAACAAARAGTGQGLDAQILDDKARSRWRQQALAWLQAERKAVAKRWQNNTPADRALVLEVATHWQREPALEALRETEALNKLPGEEREAWRKWWADVAGLIQKAKQQPPEK